MRSSIRGFTLLEISIVLVIVGILMASGAAMLTMKIRNNLQQETADKIAMLQKTLFNYRIAYNRLPCPADITVDMSNANFGVESGTPGTSCASNFISVMARGGMIPTKTLQLPDDYAVDGWGRRIFYTVDENFTYTDAFTTIPVDSTNLWLTVKVANAGVTKTSQAAYAVLSAGPNGHGAYGRVGGTARANGQSINDDELENCHCLSDGTTDTFDATVVQHLPQQDSTNYLNWFDDIVVYATRRDLRSLAE